MVGDCGGCSAGAEARLSNRSALTLSNTSHTASGSSEGATDSSAAVGAGGWSASSVAKARKTGAVKAGCIDGCSGPDVLGAGPANGGDA